MKKIKARADALPVFDHICDELVIPCIHLINADEMETSHPLCHDSSST